MRITQVALGLFASTLLPSVLATPFVPVLDDLDDENVILGPGYLVPGGMKDEDFDPNAPWAIPVINPINRDTNESRFDNEGFDLVARDAAEFEARSEGGMLAARAKKSRFWLGKNYADIGCGLAIPAVRQIMGEAVYALCSGGLCSGEDDHKYVRPVTWMGGGYARVSRILTITTSGTYSGDHTLGNIHNAVKGAVTSKSVQFADRYQYINEHITQHCRIAKFPSYIAIDKEPPNKVAFVQFWIRLNKIPQNCLATEIMAEIAGSIDGYAGLFFGAIHMLCSSSG